MRSCPKCLENKWKYEYIERWIRATCQFCDYEIEFPTKKLKREMENKNKTATLIPLKEDKAINMDDRFEA